MRAMGEDAIAIVPAAPVSIRNRDVEYPFRQDSDFLYLTGFEEPDAALVLVPDGVVLDGKSVKEVLFVNEATAMSLTWEGYRMGSVNAAKMLEVDMAKPNSEFGEVLGEIYVSPTHAARQAEESGCDLPEEIARLAVHGTLHILGYQHDTAGSRRRMLGRQERYVDRFFRAVA